jgi:hypothetical protein
MTDLAQVKIPSLRSKVSAAEWQAQLRMLDRRDPSFRE